MVVVSFPLSKKMPGNAKTTSRGPCDVNWDDLFLDNSAGNVKFQTRFQTFLKQVFPPGTKPCVLERQQKVKTATDALYKTTSKDGGKFYAHKDSQVPMSENAAKLAIEVAVRNTLKHREDEPDVETPAAKKQKITSTTNSNGASSISFYDTRSSSKAALMSRKRLLGNDNNYVEKFKDGFTSLQWMRSQRRRDFFAAI